MRKIGCSALLLLPAIASAASSRDPDTPPLLLFTGNTVVAHILAPDRLSPLEDLAIQRLNHTAREVFGFELPVISASAAPPAGSAIVLGTPEDNALLQRLDPAQAPDGFLIRSLSPTRLALVSSSGRGVFNGAIYLADFAMQAHSTGVALQTRTVRRESPIRNRGTYNLVCWGLAPRYTLQDWKNVIDGMADDGMNLIYFWLSGIFRSKLFPESFIYPETPLNTDDIRQLIAYAHTRGIEFYLGTGVFAWFGIDDIAKYRSDLRDVGIPYMSRTLPAARQAMKQYLFELYDAFPDADGMWLEIGDEGDYACKDPACQKPVDEFGSKVSGQASPSFLKDFSADLWRKYPKAKLVWGIGYPEAHKWDVKYYEELRRNFRDPRYYFLEVRQNWILQDSEGVLKPLRELSDNAMHWDQYYGLPLRDIGERARRIQEDQLAGYIVAFEPGFNTHSVYGRSLPFPIDAIPYRLTRFAYREFTFDPSLTWNGFRRRLVDHFFGENADPELADLTITLFEFMRTGPISGSFRELAHPVDGHEYGRMLKPQLLAIEARLQKLEPGLGPRARTDAGQFTINLKAPTGSRLEVTDHYVSQVEDVIKQKVKPSDFNMIVSNIGVVNDFSSLYTTNAGPYTATIQAQLNREHEISSFDYMDAVRDELARKHPELRTFFQSGSLEDAILNSGAPAPIDIQISSPSLRDNYNLAQELASRVRQLPGVGEVYIPQDMNYPGLQMEIDRVHAAELGLTQQDVVQNVITALNSNAMIAPNYWVDRQSGNNYFLTVQYYENGPAAIHNNFDLKNIPLRAPNLKEPTTLDSVVHLVNKLGPTEIDHYQIQRSADVYVTPKGEDLGRITAAITNLLPQVKHAENIRVNLLGMVKGMQESFSSFAKGFVLSFILLYLILIAQFRSFIDPFLIMLAIPMGVTGVLVILLLTNTTLNVMSLMGVLMLVGIANSNSILIVDFAHNLEGQGLSVQDAVITACRVRLRPILMTSLATIIGMIPMAMKLGAGAEQYAPMARAIIGGLTSSVILTVFIVPAAYLWIYGRKERYAR